MQHGLARTAHASADENLDVVSPRPPAAKRAPDRISPGVNIGEYLVLGYPRRAAQKLVIGGRWRRIVLGHVEFWPNTYSN